VIDYVMGDQEVRGNVEKIEIGDRVESDHHPIVVWIKGKIRRERKKERRGEIIRNRGIWWNEEGNKKFKDRIGKIEIGKGTVEEEIEEATTRMRGAIKEEKEDKEGRGRKVKGWWDEECREKKKEVRLELRRWRKEKEEGGKYSSSKREYKEVCERKRKEESERMIIQVEEAKTEGKVWELIRKERKGRKKMRK